MSNFRKWLSTGLLAAALLAGCGGNDVTPAFAGSWRETSPGAGAIEMSLLGQGSTVSGAGVLHGNPDRGFAVRGNVGPAAELRFNYLDGGIDTFTTIIADQDQLVLNGSLGTLTFARE